MKTKVVSLALLIVFATIATSVNLCLSNSQTVKRDVGFAIFDDIPRVSDNATDEPQGIAIDTPDMPG